MIIKLPNLATVPRELREFIMSLRDWCRERERFEKSITSPADTRSASGQMALKQGIVVDRTRVDTLATGATVDTSGSLIPTVNNAFDIGSTTFRWRDLFLSRNADIDGTLDVLGNVNLAGTATIAGLSMIGGASMAAISGTTLNLTGPVIASGQGIFTSGVSISGGFTVSGSAAFSGTGFTGNLVPITNLTGSIGVNASRWGQIFGGTLTITNQATARQFNAIGIDATSNFNGNVEIGSTLTITGLATFNGGITVGAGFTSSGQGSFLSGITVAGGLTSSGQIGGLAGISVGGLADFVGISASGVITSGGQFQARSGITATGGVTIGGMVFISAAAANGFTGSIVPIGNLLGNVGLTARRWAQIFGGTLTTTNTATIGGTLTVSGAGNHSMDGSLQTNALTVVTQFTPTADGAVLAGAGNPTISPDLRWGGCFLSGILTTAKGTDIASGTTLSFNAAGNYFDVTGVSTIQGISYDNTTANPQAGIFNFIQFDSNAKMVHVATRQVLLGGVTFAGETGDHMLLISDGGGNWREVFRQRASGIRHQSTATNKSMGRATLIGGVTIVANTMVTANSNIFTSRMSSGGTLGDLFIGSVTAGASFSINSVDALDTSVVAWEIVEPEGV